jgi:hypothetical protein
MLGALLFALVFLAGLFAGKATRAAWESQPACWNPLTALRGGLRAAPFRFCATFRRHGKVTDNSPGPGRSRSTRDVYATHERDAISVRPATPACWADMVSSRAQAIHGERMTMTPRPAPSSRPASFSNLNEGAVDIPNRRRLHRSTGRDHKTKDQHATQTYYPCLHDHFPVPGSFDSHAIS